MHGDQRLRRSDDWSRALNIPNLSRVVKYNEPRMPWPEVVALLQNIPVWKSRAIPGYITLRGLNSG